MGGLHKSGEVVQTDIAGESHTPLEAGMLGICIPLPLLLVCTMGGMPLTRVPLAAGALESLLTTSVHDSGH
jgi:hypothetical protein